MCDNYASIKLLKIRDKVMGRLSAELGRFLLPNSVFEYIVAHVFIESTESWVGWTDRDVTLQVSPQENIWPWRLEKEQLEMYTLSAWEFSIGSLFG